MAQFRFPLRWLIGVIAALLITLLFIMSAVVAAVLQKSMVPWPVAAPTRVAAGALDYPASGWYVASSFGWRPDPQQPGGYTLHEGLDLAGPWFCLGCAVPPLGDVIVAFVGWDQPWGLNPLQRGAGVVVDLALQHPEEAGTVRVRYGHLHPYHVHVRTRSCTQLVDCPAYHLDDAASVSISCPGQVVPISRGDGERSYAYATPGECIASVAWPSPYLPQGAVRVPFDQRIVPGVAASDAAITFNAQLPPPITPTLTLPLPTPIP